MHTIELQCQSDKWNLENLIPAFYSFPQAFTTIPITRKVSLSL